MENRKFGYIRVSSRDQNEGRQIESMKALGISERDIYIDKQSGKDFDREQYQLLKRNLRRGDTLYLHSLDRFGRNKEAILKEWQEITNEIQANIIVLDMPLLDTTQNHHGVGRLISDIVLQLLSWLAEEERTKIKQRQAEGIELAKAQGKHLGRPKTEITDAFISAYNQWKAGQIKAVEAMKLANMKKATFYNIVRQYEAEQQANQ